MNQWIMSENRKNLGHVENKAFREAEAIVNPKQRLTAVAPERPIRWLIENRDPTAAR